MPSVARKVSQVTPRSRPCYQDNAASARTCRGLEIRRPRSVRSWTGLAQAPVCGSRRASGAPTSDERRGGVRELFVSYCSNGQPRYAYFSSCFAAAALTDPAGTTLFPPRGPTTCPEWPAELVEALPKEMRTMVGWSNPWLPRL